MKIIEKGNKRVTCGRCGCIMEFDSSDIKSEIKSYISGVIFRTFEDWKIEYINCPQCDNKIRIGFKQLK